MRREGLQELKDAFAPENYIIPGLQIQDILDLKQVFDEFDLNGDG